MLKQLVLSFSLSPVTVTMTQLSGATTCDLISNRLALHQHRVQDEWLCARSVCFCFSLHTCGHCCGKVSAYCGLIESAAAVDNSVIEQKITRVTHLSDLVTLGLQNLRCKFTSTKDKIEAFNL